MSVSILRLKFVLLGDPATGKRTYFEKFSRGSPSAKNNAIKQIDNIDVHLYNFPITTFPVQMLLRDADAILFFFDFTNRASFESITEKWIPLFDSNAHLMKPHSSYMIIGTKSDLEEERVVSEKEASEMAKLLGVSFMDLFYSLDDPIEYMIHLFHGMGILEGKNDDIIYLSPQIFSPSGGEGEEGGEGCCSS